MKIEETKNDTEYRQANTAVNLIPQITVRWQAYKACHPSASCTCNLFHILEASDKEVLICRMLADLLNPSGSHRKGSYYLYHFLRDVLHVKKITKHFLDTAETEKEYTIPGTDRRIDLAVYNDQYFLPIEVKIHAKEQPSQCYDYYQYARTRNTGRDTKVCYLTIDGRLPSEYSLSKYDTDGKVVDQIRTDRILPVSFRRDIVPWLRHLLFYGAEAIQGEEREIMMQYLQAVEEFSGAVREESREVVAKALLETSENLRTGLQIADAVNAAKAALIREVMEELDIQMKPVAKAYRLAEEKTYHYYTYEEQATEEFYTAYSTYPGINYRVAKLDKRYELWFRIEVEHHLFAGFCVFDCERRSEYVREEPAEGNSASSGLRDAENAESVRNAAPTGIIETSQIQSQLEESKAGQNLKQLEESKAGQNLSQLEESEASQNLRQPEGSGSKYSTKDSGQKVIAHGDKLIHRTQELEQRLLDFLDIQRIDLRIDNWWVRWAHLPTGSRQTKGDFARVPDFRHMNEAAIRLADPKTRTAFAAECVKIIQSRLLNLLRTDPGKEQEDR